MKRKDSFALAGRAVDSRNGPIAFDAAEMVDADDVEALPCRAQAAHPPREAVLLHMCPVIDGIAPVLAIGVEAVRRAARNDAWTAGTGQLEILRVRPDIGGIQRNIDGDIADDQHAVFMGILPQPLPLRYFRLAGVCLEVAPLRDRLEDVPLLIANVLKRYGKNASVVTPAILDAIRRYSWPGNIRELMSVMESYLVLLGDNSSSLACFEEIFRHRNQFFDKAPQGGTLGEQLAAYRLEIVRKEMRRCAGDRRKAARALGISYSSLRRVLEADAAKDVSVQD